MHWKHKCPVIRLQFLSQFLTSLMFEIEKRLRGEVRNGWKFYNAKITAFTPSIFTEAFSTSASYDRRDQETFHLKKRKPIPSAAWTKISVELKADWPHPYMPTEYRQTDEHLKTGNDFYSAGKAQTNTQRDRRTLSSLLYFLLMVNRKCLRWFLGKNHLRITLISCLISRIIIRDRNS